MRERCQNVGANRDAEVLDRLSCLYPVVDAGVKCFGLVSQNLLRGIEGLSVASRPILEKGGTVVYISERSVVVGLTEELAVFACAPSLWPFAEAFGA